MQKQGSPLLGDSGLGLEDLFKKFFPQEPYEGHKGILDAMILKRLFTETGLKDELSSLEKRTFDEWIGIPAVAPNVTINPYTNRVQDLDQLPDVQDKCYTMWYETHLHLHNKKT